MSDLDSLIRQITPALIAVQNAIQTTGNQEDITHNGAETPNAESVAKFKDTIDRTRHLLWRYTESSALQHEGENAPAEQEDQRLQLASEFQWLLAHRAAPGDFTQEDTASFFERIDSISDRLLAEHHQNKSTSDAPAFPSLSRKRWLGLKRLFPNL
jgi:hypothetical protein